jgi:hypothetical protein
MRQVIVRIQYPDSEVVIPVDGLVYGDAGSVARRLRSSGVSAQRRGSEVIVNGQGPCPKVP